MSEVMQVFAFSTPAGGGNPAGVVLDADNLSPTQMQEVAARAGFPETAFVSKSKKGGFRFDFFTPTRRIADCGHATVAAFSVLKKRDPSLRETTKEIEAGIRKILIEGPNVFMEQPVPSITEIKDGWIVRHDVGFAIFELNTEEDLADLQPNLKAIEKCSQENDLVGFYYFVRKSGPIAATTRMFAPAYGIPEESATGMAAGLLSALLTQSAERADLTIEQGRYMAQPSPSLIFCKVRRDENRIWVGGSGRTES